MTNLIDVDNFDCFLDIDDPRALYNQCHSLYDILVIAICAVISGADGWNDIETFGNSREAWLRTFLRLPYGIPSHDTFQRVISRIDSNQFSHCFLRWIQTLATQFQDETIAIDGKKLRRSFDHTTDRNPIHMVSAWASEQRLVLAQSKVDEKSNEITAIPELLRVLDITGAIVTIDAMGCQKEIATQIINGDGDYILALKDNHPKLAADVRQLFADSQQDDIIIPTRTSYETVERRHGRTERRIYTVIDAPAHIHGYHEWDELKTLIQVETERSDRTTTLQEKRYYISSVCGDAERIGTAIRHHWGIENSVHWVLDVVFREDESRINTNDGAQNFAILRHIALNLLRKETTSKKSVRQKRFRATLDETYLERVLAGLL